MYPRTNFFSRGEDRREEDEGQDRVARTERESDRKREMADLLVLPRLAKSLQDNAGFSGKT